MFNDFFSKLQAQARSLTANLDKEGRNVSNVELLQMLQNAGFGAAPTYVSDREYVLPASSAIANFLKGDGTDKYKYRAEGNDCDDFACILKGRVTEQCVLEGVKRGMAFGIVHGYLYLGDQPPIHHAMNVVVVNDGNVWLIEPQDDRFYPVDPRNTYHALLI